MAKINNSNRMANWDAELSVLREKRQARRDGVEYTPETPQPAVQQAAYAPQAPVREVAQQLFTQSAARVEISIEQLTAEVNGRVYKPENISYERVSVRTRERTNEMGNRI